MTFVSQLTTLLGLALGLFLTPLSAGQGLRFLAIGDVPYSEAEHESLSLLLTRELGSAIPFLVHVGDFKASSAPCTDDAYAEAADLFRSQPVPVVYTPGDNEWTDCRRPAAGGHDPQERLALLRERFFRDPSVLRLRQLDIRVTDPAYPENYRFWAQGALIATLHLVGSRDNRVPGDPAALREHASRGAANHRHLQAVAEEAASREAEAVVLLFHANAGLERETATAAYASFRTDLFALLEAYAGPLLLIHGDTHKFRFDRPLRNPSTGKTVERLYRLEVPGSPIVGGAWVNLETEDGGKAFRVEPVYPVALEGLTR
jgi:hypothetical protein